MLCYYFSSTVICLPVFIHPDTVHKMFLFGQVQTCWMVGELVSSAQPYAHLETLVNLILKLSMAYFSIVYLKQIDVMKAIFASKVNE